MAEKLLNLARKGYILLSPSIRNPDLNQRFSRPSFSGANSRQQRPTSGGRDRRNLPTKSEDSGSLRPGLPASGSGEPVERRGDAARAPALPRPSCAPLPGAPGLRVLAPTPPWRGSSAAAPAHARGFAQGGERRRPWAPGPEPVRLGKPAWSGGRCRLEDRPAPSRPRAEMRESAPRSRPGAGR